ncbi:MAG: glycosyltransferase [Acidobacteriota bacterium]
MNILLLGKYPPIEGGVSAYTFWMARALAGQGHAVRIATNAGEVEPTLSQLHYHDDHSWLEGDGVSGGPRIYQTTALSPSSFIPFAQPYVTKLFGLSLSILEEAPCDVILSWYFEPYGFAAALVGKATGLPFVIRHAGSDLGRLSQHPDLKAAYQWALETASGLIVTNEREFERRFGSVAPPRIRPTLPSLPDIFSSPSVALDVPELLEASDRWFSEAGLPGALLQAVRGINAKTFTGKIFTIGTYGKVGVTKGSFDLIEALSKVAETGTEFSFLTLSCGHPETLAAYYDAIAGSRALAERTWILPPVAPWRVPSFLRCCNAVCFLERDFPIAFHGPQVPREVLSSGACLVCSGEVARKPFYGGHLVDDRNAIIVDDPKDHDSLALRLLALIGDQDRTWSIGRQGQRLAEFWDQELPCFDDAVASLFTDIERTLAASTSGRRPPPAVS